MTETGIVRVEPIVAAQRAQAVDLISAIRAATDLDDLKEARARVEALRAWAKVHGQAKQMRLDLLRVEVAALIRVVELGGIDSLPTGIRAAARWLADRPWDELEAFLTESGEGVSTASGMVRTIQRIERIEQENERLRRRAIEIGNRPPVPDRESALEEARERAIDVAGALASIVENYGNSGASFTVEEMADEIIEASALPSGVAVDDVVREGLHRVCREALRKAPPIKVAGSSLPRVITARDEEGLYFRVPVMSATLAHLDDMIAIRSEQIQADQEALERLVAIRDRLSEVRGSRPEDTPIGALVAGMMTSEAA